MAAKLRTDAEKRKAVPIITYLYQVAGSKKRKLANALQEKSEKYTKGQKLLGLFAFILVAATCNVWVMRNAMHHQGRSRVVNYTGPPSQQTPVELPGPDKPYPPDMGAHRKIMQYKGYLDSLSKTKDGQLLLKKILKSHPGLKDSLGLYLRLYKDQNPGQVPERKD